MVALLTTARGAELCLLRHASPHAATIQIYASLEAGEAVRLDLADGSALCGTVASRRDSLAILAVSPAAQDAPGEPRDAGLRARLPRLDVGLPVQLRIAGTQSPATLCNISQGGAKIRADGLGVGLKVALLVGGLPPLAGRMRWIKEGAGGMSFYQPIPLDILAPWSAALGARIDAGGKVMPVVT